MALIIPQIPSQDSNSEYTLSALEVFRIGLRCSGSATTTNALNGPIQKPLDVILFLTVHSYDLSAKS
jgi:hypothetical protein